MNEQQIIEYLRARGRVEVPPGLVAAVMAGVEAAPAQPSRFSPYPPAAAAVGVAAVIAALALLLGPWRDIGPSPSPPAPSASASAVSPEELESTVTAALDRLSESTGVRGIHRVWIEEYLAAVTWFDWRRGGDQVSVTRTDVDVRAPWWLDPGAEPLTVGERIETEITATVGDTWYRTESGAWVVEDESETRAHITYATGMLSGAIPAVPPRDDAVSQVATRRLLADGSELWTLELAEGEERFTMTWRIGADGRLAWHAAEGTDPGFERSGVTGGPPARIEIDFEPLDDPEPIRAPDPSAPPDPAWFDMPDDVPLAPTG